MKKFTLLALLGLLCTVYSRATVTFTVITPPCDTTGVLQVSFTPSGGGPYNVQWAGGAGAMGYATTTTSTGTSSITNYSGSRCHVDIYDASWGLVDSGTFAGALPFDFTFATTPFCTSTGATTVTTIGGTPPFTYSWYSTAAPSTVLATTATASLPAGFYGVWIKDAAGCITGSTLKFTTTWWGVGGPYYDSVYPTPTFSFSVATTTASCTNGTASVAGITSGAVPPLSYLWSTGSTATSISGLSMGTYSATITDATGCAFTASNAVLQSITISAPITPSPSTCGAPDGSLIAFGSGGVSPYTYHWSNGATTQSQSGLLPGYYGVTVTDANGCIGTNNIWVSTSTPITVTYATTPSNCTAPTGSATLTMAGGTAPYSVYWYTSPVQTTATATTLAPGNYHFKVTDASGCIQTGAVIVPPIHIISTPFSETSPYCALSTGSLGVTPSGGTAPYTYLWSTGATTATISSLPAGLYHVTVTDAAGCHVTNSHSLVTYSPMTLGIATTPATCLFNADGIITATGIGGTPPYTYYPGGGSSGVIPGLLTDHYWVTVSDMSGCTATRYVYLGYNASNTSCYCSIEGTVYHDVNGNCTQDAGEPGISNIQMKCSGRGYAYTDAFGHYSFKVPSGTYTISETVLAFYPLSPCQSNSITVTASAATGCVIPQDFANVINPIHDMHVSIWDYDWAVVGNAYHSIAIISNDGTVPEPTILASYKPDGQLLSPSFIPAGIFSGSPYYYNTVSTFPTMAPGASQTFFRNYTVPTDVPLGTVVNFKDSIVHAAPMSDWILDYSPWNNVAAYTTTVVASFDPNFKEVRPQGVGPHGIIQYTDTVLEYMVHFQNTGSWYAQNIVVLDTLDDDLDWTSLKPVYQSANCKVTLTQSGTYKIAKFDFQNINLPPQMWDDLRSNGMFTYTIRPKSGLAVGTQFKNRASIYFDYNAPILTNETVNTLVSYIPGGVATLPTTPSNSFVVYPNPTAGSFAIALNSDHSGLASLTITDVTGKTMLSKTIELSKGQQSFSTDASQLAPGVYFVSLHSNGKTETQKLVVIK